MSQSNILEYTKSADKSADKSIDKFPNAIPLQFKTFYSDAYNPNRRIKLILLSDILGRTAEFKSMKFDKQTEIIRDIEQGCYNEATKQITDIDQDPVWTNTMFLNMYNYICGNLFQNLDPSSEINSTYLIDKILNNTIDLLLLGRMSSDELCPEKSREIKQQIGERADIKYSTKSSTMYRCGKCKRNECILERMHTRGLDESTNYRATCVFCKHTWMT